MAGAKMTSGYDMWNMPGTGTVTPTAPATGGSGGAMTGLAALGAANPYVFVAMAAFQVVNGLNQAELVRSQAEIGRTVANMNADYAEVDAFNVQADNFGDIAQYQGQARQQTADAEAELAFKDVDKNFGTAKEVLDENKLTNFLNVLDLQNQARAKAMGMKQTARGIRMGGQFAQAAAEAQASSVTAQGFMQGGTTLASGYEKGADYGSMIPSWHPLGKKK